MSEQERSVLIVDDLSMFRVILRDMLEELGFTRIDEAASGAEALSRLQSNTFSLILSDYMMKPLDGLELLRRVKSDQETAHIPFIMISAKNELDFAVQAMSLGAHSYLLRPLAYDALKKQLSEVFPEIADVHK